MARGQVTVFMIVGILLLVVFAVILFITNSATTVSIETEGAPVIDTVPQQFNGIQIYTTNCLDSIAEQGLIILGQQGGHITPTTLGDYSPNNPTDSVGINLNSQLVPYWHYNSQPNGNPAVYFESNTPELKGHDNMFSIESQLGDYVNREIGRCLNEYGSFEGQGFDITTGEISTTARVFDGYVDFILDMPLEAQKESAQASMDQFYTRVDVDLKNMYEVSKEITEFQVNSSFIEQHFLNVFRVHMGTSPHRFPSVLTVQFDDNPSEFWLTSELQVRLKDLLNQYIPLLRYGGADNFYRHEFAVSDLSGLYQQTSDDMILPLTSGTGLDINFNYFGWEPYLNVNGGQEELRPTQISIQAPFDIIQYDVSFEKFVNTYDVSFPVLVTLEDDKAFSGKGFSFNFGLEANVINNKPIDREYVQPAPLKAGVPSLVCNNNQRNTEVIRTLVVDAATQEPLEFVNFGFSIPDQGHCSQGQTDSRGVHEEQYPPVIGGVLDLSLDGYLDEYFSLDTYAYRNEPGIVGYAVAGIDGPVLELYPKKEIKLSVKKKNVEKCIVTADVQECVESTITDKKFNECVYQSPGRVCFFNSGGGQFLPDEPDLNILVNGSSSRWNQFYFIDSAKELATMDVNGADERVMGVFKRVSDVYGELPGFSSEPFTAQFDAAFGEETTIELVPGIYKVFMSSRLIFDPNVPYLTPTDERCFTTNKNSCANITGQSVTEGISGFVNWNESSTYFVVTNEDLYSSDVLEIYALSQNLIDVPVFFESDGNDGSRIYNSRVIEDASALGKLNQLSQEPRIRNALAPQWLLEADVQ